MILQGFDLSIKANLRVFQKNRKHNLVCRIDVLEKSAEILNDGKTHADLKCFFSYNKS